MSMTGKKAAAAQDFVKRMREIASRSKIDPEKAHGLADDLLVEVLRKEGYEELVKEYHRVYKWYA